MTLVLTVHNFTLPSSLPPSYATAFGVYSTGILKGYYGAQWEAHTNESVHVTQEYADLALMHRITLSNMMASDWPALSAQPVDWPAFAARWLPFVLGHSLPWGLRDAAAAVFEIPPAAFDPGQPNSTRAVQYWRGFAAMARQHGFLERTFDYTCDEPHDNASYAVCEARGNVVKYADPDIPVLITAEWPEAQAFGAATLIDTMVPIINFVENARDKCDFFPTWTFGNHRPDYDAFARQPGKRLWWYQSCLSHGCSGGCDPATRTCYSGWPSYMVDAPAVMARVMSWLSYLYAMGGELYWGTNYQDQMDLDPWVSLWQFGGNGDGTLTYPGVPHYIGGTTPIPIASMRLKYIRDGLEDLLYMLALEEKSGRQAVLQLIGSVVQNTFTYTRNNTLLFDVREMLAQAISA